MRRFYCNKRHTLGRVFNFAWGDIIHYSAKLSVAFRDDWTGATFTYPSTPLALTGTRLRLQCAQCHVNNNYALTSGACSNCHLTDYNNVSIRLTRPRDLRRLARRATQPPVGRVWSVLSSATRALGRRGALLVPQRSLRREHQAWRVLLVKQARGFRRTARYRRRPRQFGSIRSAATRPGRRSTQTGLVELTISPRCYQPVR